MRIALVSAPGSDEISKDDPILAAALSTLGASPEVQFWTSHVVDWSAYDLVVVRTTWDYHLRLNEFFSWIDHVSTITRVLNPPQLIHWNAHKEYLLELETGGTPTVPTRVLENLKQLESNIGEWGSRRLVLKPEVGASAQDTFLLSPEEPELIRKSCAHLLKRGKALLQPYFERIETEGEVSLVWIAGEVAHAIQKRPKPGDYRVQTDYGGTNERIEPPEDGLDLAIKCMELLPCEPLFARCDAVRDDDGELRLMELELIEPELMFEWAPESAAKLARALLKMGQIETSN